LINIGPASTAAQGPVTVTLMASTRPRLNSGSTTIATYTVADIPSISQVSSGTQVLGDNNVNPQNNIVTVQSAPVTLPVSPKVYFIGVVADPFHTIKQLSGVGRAAGRTTFSEVRRVGPPIKGLPPAGVLYGGGGFSNLPFPFPPNVIPSGTTS